MNHTKLANNHKDCKTFWRWSVTEDLLVHR
jgi:hypothetical protein